MHIQIVFSIYIITCTLLRLIRIFIFELFYNFDFLKNNFIVFFSLYNYTYIHYYITEIILHTRYSVFFQIL